MKVVKEKRKGDEVMKVTIGEMVLLDQTITFNRDLVSSKSKTKNKDLTSSMLDIKITNVSKQSPDYRQVDEHIDVLMKELQIKFFPETIN